MFTTAPGTESSSAGAVAKVALTATVYSSPITVVKFFVIKLRVVLVVTCAAPDVSTTVAGDCTDQPLSELSKSLSSLMWFFFTAGEVPLVHETLFKEIVILKN